MKYIAKIIYTLVICRFLMCIRERLVPKFTSVPVKYLLIGYYPKDGTALLFGYADNEKAIYNLIYDLHVHGFETWPGEQIAVVHPIGNNMFKDIISEKRIGPYRLCTTTRSRWYDVAQKHGMKREVIDRMCGIK